MIAPVSCSKGVDPQAPVFDNPPSPPIGTRQCPVGGEPPTMDKPPATGMVAELDGVLVMHNPDYTLLTGINE